MSWVEFSLGTVSLLVYCDGVGVAGICDQVYPSIFGAGEDPPSPPRVRSHAVASLPLDPLHPPLHKTKAAVSLSLHSREREAAAMICAKGGAAGPEVHHDDPGPS